VYDAPPISAAGVAKAGQLDAAERVAAAVSAAVSVVVEAKETTIVSLRNEIVSLQATIAGEAMRQLAAVNAAKHKEGKRGAKRAALQFQLGLNAAMRVLSNKQIKMDGTPGSSQGSFSRKDDTMGRSGSDSDSDS